MQVLLQEDTGINVSRQKQVISTTIPLPYHLKFYSIKYKIQALAFLWPLFRKIRGHLLLFTLAQVYTATIHLKIIIRSHFSADSQQQYEDSLGYICESRTLFMRIVSFKCEL